MAVVRSGQNLRPAIPPQKIPPTRKGLHDPYETLARRPPMPKPLSSWWLLVPALIVAGAIAAIATGYVSLPHIRWMRM